jgi:hypothetical protein
MLPQATDWGNILDQGKMCDIIAFAYECSVNYQGR